MDVAANVRAALEDLLYSFVSTHRGSISAEHGVGQLKLSKLHYTRSPASLALIRRIKRELDPNGILNPGKFVVV